MSVDCSVNCCVFLSSETSRETSETKESAAGRQTSHSFAVPGCLIPAQSAEPSEPIACLATHATHSQKLQYVHVHTQLQDITSHPPHQFTTHHMQRVNQSGHTITLSLSHTHMHSLTHVHTHLSPLVAGYSSLLSDNDVSLVDTPGTPPPMPPKKHPHDPDHGWFSSEVLVSPAHLLAQCCKCDSTLM